MSAFLPDEALLEDYPEECRVSLAGLVAASALRPEVIPLRAAHEWAEIWIGQVVRLLGLPAALVNGLLPFLPPPNDGSGTSTTHSADLPSLVLPWLDREEADRRRAVQGLIAFCAVRGCYGARTRVCLRHVAVALGLSWVEVALEFERGLALAVEDRGAEKAADTDKDRAEKKKKQRLRALKVGAMAAVGGTLLAVTGGLAAPALGAGLLAFGGAGGALGTIGAFVGSAGGVALMTVTFGAGGAGLTGFKMAHRTSGLREFFFQRVRSDSERRLVVHIGLSGFQSHRDELPYVWGRSSPLPCDNLAGEALDSTFELEPDGGAASSAAGEERYVCVYERDEQVALGNAIQRLLVDQAVGMAVSEALKHTALAALTAAVAWPAAVVKAADFIDNSFSVMMNRADAAGEELASVLLKRIAGSRPVTLVGFGFGARAIWRCMLVLSAKLEAARQAESAVESRGAIADRGTGGSMSEAERLALLGDALIEDVVLLGGVFVGDAAQWKRVRSVAAGCIVNGYSASDWVLAYYFRAIAVGSGGLVAGLGPTGAEGVDDVDFAEDPFKVKSHSDWRRALPVCLDFALRHQYT